MKLGIKWDSAYEGVFWNYKVLCPSNKSSFSKWGPHSILPPVFPYRALFFFIAFIMTWNRYIYTFIQYSFLSLYRYIANFPYCYSRLAKYLYLYLYLHLPCEYREALHIHNDFVLSVSSRMKALWGLFCSLCIPYTQNNAWHTISPQIFVTCCMIYIYITCQGRYESFLGTWTHLTFMIITLWNWCCIHFPLAHLLSRNELIEVHVETSCIFTYFEKSPSEFSVQLFLFWWWCLQRKSHSIWPCSPIISVLVE